MGAEGVNLSFHNARSLLKRIDSLPTGPAWSCSSFEVTGNKTNKAGNLRTEEVELWHRNPVECIREIIRNPTFREYMSYQPARVYRKSDFTSREYNEMWICDWWWQMQARLPEGATVVPVILSSDKTNLSRFSGDKQAWPVYLGIGNVSKAIRRKPTAHAMVLVGYIPVCKLDCFTKNKRSDAGYQLFHECMRKILEPLKAAGTNGLDVVCADGFVRTIFPVLSTYIADYPEQCLVACCKESACPRCTVNPKLRGDYRTNSVLRDPDKTLAAIEEKVAEGKSESFKDQSLRRVNPFWKDLPHCDIFTCFTPDILHQLHKGIFKDHISAWATESMAGGEDEVDERFKAMTPHPDLRHFKRGISLTSQWTGTEHKNMEKVFLGVLAGATEPRVISAVRGVLDFIYYAHFETHTDHSLQFMDDAWERFHLHKDVFKDLGIRKHFNISKLHNVKHYMDSIRSHGSADGSNTEGTERLHIDLAKMGYQAGNKRDYIKFMTVWLRRQEAIHQRCIYLQWAIPGYTAPILDVDGPESGSAGDGQDMGGADEPDDKVVARDEGLTYHLAKKPAFVGASAQSITSDYGAINFVHHFNDYLARAYPGARVAAMDSTTFSLYKKVTLKLPVIFEVSETRIQDSIYATKPTRSSVTTQGIKRGQPAKTSTVLVRIRQADPTKGPLDGLQAAQVLVIFSMPEQFANSDTALAYVVWFKPFRTPAADIGMFTTANSTRNHRRRASVIPLTDIIHSCHLIPVFGSASATDLGWTSTTSLQEASSFYLNPYLRHYDFYFYRYMVDLHLQQEDERQKQLEVAQARGIRPKHPYVYRG
ncbi:hypothetical protein HYPSUDRAFT_129651 [Hypholoma sublateritium FD-334 SS-4]|uniref:Uncharacterized protein n=1 Tax=Hypholoma sublateritium (strain FD-334 SS-4) TaxID=945553 RepID=A0A0D2LKK4_HYPSF|nr:hypothetical protein HYPSUDRAFT_129651 [Hypholoma sublateritium FD-334 SS-4]